MILKISTAWLQLKYEKLRLSIALGGISFAVVLIFMQFGLRAALLDSAVALHTKLAGEIFLISPRSTALIAMEPFSERRLYQALAFEEVRGVAPIYLGFAQWKNSETRDYWRNIYVIGFDLDREVFDLPEVHDHIDKLKIPDVVLFDAASRDEFGSVASQFRQKGKVTTEIGDRGPGNRRISVVGLFHLGASFGADGNIITSELNFLRIFPRRRRGFINLGVVKLREGSDIDSVVARMRSSYPKDIKILSKQDFIDFEKEYWNSTTPIGFTFAFGVVLGLMIGTIIVYQILYSNVAEHLAEYATLKAMGYKHQYLINIVFQESLILAFLGYIPGFVFSLGTYQITRNATNLPIGMETNRAIFVLLLTFIMCFFSGAIAINKLKEADPADIF